MSSSDTPKTILIKGRGIPKEGLAVHAITPGMLVANGTASDTIIKHPTAGGFAQPMFARENELIGDDIDTDIAAADEVYYEVLPPGAEVYAFITASGAAVVRGSPLESAGDGCLRLWSPPADLSDSSTGTASGTIAAIAAGTYSGTTIGNALASIVAKVNGIMPQANSVVAIALEAVDNSGTASARRIKVEVR
jgi:hypothetical protein